MICFLVFVTPLQAEELCPVIGKIEHLDWFSDDAKQYISKTDGIWKRKESVTVIDVETGVYFQMSRNGGDNHADCETETKEDTARLKSIYGKWSWDKRSVLVLIGDKTFAASIHGMPHGGNRITSNKLGGHVCIHFLHSKLHANGKEDQNHQDKVVEAFNSSVDDIQSLINEFYDSKMK